MALAFIVDWKDCIVEAGATVNAIVLTDIPYSEIAVISQNRLFLRFSTAQAGKAIVLGGV